MKPSMILFACALVAGCSGNNAKQKAQRFIPGIYTRAIDQEHARGMDTLTVSVIDQNAGTYSIVQQSGYHRILDGTELPAEHTTEKYTAVYDAERQQLEDQHKGKVFTVVPEKHLILLGTTEYRKTD